MKSTRHELSNCNFAKTILMMIIILFHSCVFWRGDWFTQNPAIESVFLSVFAQFLSHFHNYGFVVISGYLFYYLQFEEEHYSSFRIFFIKKIRRLIRPYFFVLVFWVIPFALILLKYDISTIMSFYLLGRAPNQLWFLLMLFWVYMISYHMSRIWEKYPFVIGFLISLTLYGFGVAAELIVPNYFQIWTGLKYATYFFIGFSLRKKQNKTEMLIQHAEILFIIYIILFFILYWIENSVTVDGMLLKACRELYVMILNSIGGVMAFSKLMKIAEMFNWQNAPLLKRLEPYSLQMYLFHQQIIWVMIICLNGLVHPLINVIINFFIAVTISYTLAYLCKKNRFLNKMLGY